MQKCPLPVIVDLQHICQNAVLIAVRLGHFGFSLQRPDREQNAVAVIRFETFPLRLSERADVQPIIDIRQNDCIKNCKYHHSCVLHKTLHNNVRAAFPASLRGKSGLSC